MMVKSIGIFVSQMDVVRFLNLSVTDGGERKEFSKCLNELLDTGMVVMGQKVQEFEDNFSKFCSRKFAVGVGSGTAGLYLAIKALKIPPGREIITSPLSWVSSSNAIILNNLVPVFVDIDDYLNIDPDLIEERITSKTAGILSIDFAGQMCDYKKLSQLSERRKIPLIEDSSQAMGAVSDCGPAGSQGMLSATSHNPMKSLAALGEAGSVTTDSEELYERLKILRYSGTLDKSDCIEPSINGRLDTLQAHFLDVRLKNLDSIIEKRNKNAEFYDKHLHTAIKRPLRAKYTRKHAYYTYQINTQKRDELMQRLFEKGIETKIQHNPLISDQTYYRSNVVSQEMPKSAKHAKESLCLPIHEKLTEDELVRVIKSVQECADALGL